MKFKDNKGVTGVDLSIAIVILIVFISFIAALFYNLSYTAKEIERKSTATNIAIKVIEALKATQFEDLTQTLSEEDGNSTFIKLTESDLDTLISEKIPNGYTVRIFIQDYNSENIIKIIKVEVTYKQRSNTENITIETLVKNV